MSHAQSRSSNMKRIFGYIALSAALLVGATSCQKDEVDSSISVIKPGLKEKTPFDNWLQANFLDAYNVDYMYRMTDNETPRGRNLSPATIENSMRMAKLVKHSWFGVYDEVAGTNFMRQYAPRQIQIVGSSAKGLLGTAEQGLKVVLYQINNIDLSRLEDLNWTYFGTMHHEFAHILHQHKKWPVAFNEVSAGDYLPGTWYNSDVATMSVYAPLGFVTAYSRKQDSEDVAEVTAAIICWTDAQWTQLYNAAGEAGTKKINQKVEIMKKYMLESYGVDLDKLREVARRRLLEAPALQFVEPDWEAQIAHTLRAAMTPVPSNPTADYLWLFDSSKGYSRQQQCQVYLQHCGHSHSVSSSNH